MKLIAYAPQKVGCGISEYHRFLIEGLPEGVQCVTEPLSPERVGRRNLIKMTNLKQRMINISRKSRKYDGAIIQYYIRYFNGFNPGESLIPVFSRMLGCPTVVIIHEFYPGRQPFSHGGSLFERNAKRLILKVTSRLITGFSVGENPQDFLFRRADTLVIHTEEYRKPLEMTGIEPGRILFTRMPHYPLPSPSWKDSHTDERLGLKGRRLILLFGLWENRKGFDLAVRALPFLPDDIVMVLAGGSGDPIDRPVDLMQLAEQLGVGGRFHYAGHMPDPELASVLRRATLGLSPFRYVAGSSSLGYFFTAGVPVAASNLPSIADLVSAGAGIRLFPPNDVAGIVTTVNELLADPTARHELSLRNLSYAKDNGFASLAGKIVAQIEAANSRT